MGSSTPWVIATQVFKPGSGQGRPCYELARLVASTGCTAYLVGNQIADDLRQMPGVKVVLHSRPRGSTVIGDLFLDRKTRQTVRLLSLDKKKSPIVAMGGGTAIGSVNWVHYLHSAWFPGYRPWWTLHGIKHRLNNRYQVSRECRALRSADLIIANSHHTRDEIIRHIGVDSSKVHVVYYGSDESETEPITPLDRQQARITLQLKPDLPVVSFVAGLGTDHRKGFDTLIQAWAIRRERLGQDPGIILAAGPGNLPYWQQKIRASGLDNSIRLLGYRNDVANLLAASDLLVSPTRYEPYGLNVHEALCRGIPAIVTRATGVGERYPSELQGWLLENPDDPIELESAISKIVDYPSSGALYRVPLERFAMELKSRSWRDMAEDIVNIWTSQQKRAEL